MTLVLHRRPAEGGHLSAALLAESPLVPAAIVVFATLFNAGLAVANGNVTSLGSAAVVGAEVACVGAAHAFALTHWRREMAPWYALIGAFAAFALVRSFAFGTFEVKYLRDVLILPTFVVLGMTFDSRYLGRLVVGIQVIVLVVLALEAVNTDLYAAVFKIQDYYINTRGYDIEDFWNKGSDLFVNAVRPDDRFFSLVDLHRLSSVFLEPVSLGNYCMVVTAFLCACGGELKPGPRWFLIISTALAAIGCDGRLAMSSVPPMVLCTWLAPRLPRAAALLYIPGITAVAFGLVAAFGFQPGGDDFPGRIAHTVYLLQAYGPWDVLGLSDRFMSKAVDSGIAYLITTQSIFLVMILWATLGLAGRTDQPAQIRFLHAAMIYISLNMMVSYALLTIKTAALLWFILGSLQRRGAGSSRALRAVPSRGGRAPAFGTGPSARRPAS